MVAAWDVVAAVVVAIGVARHSMVVFSSARAARFVAGDGTPGHSISGEPDLHWYVIIPVLRESGVARAVHHFRAVAAPVSAQVIVVTCEREHCERRSHPHGADTIAIVQELARLGECTHLHCPDASGVKADQLNFAVDWLAARLSSSAAERAFVVCYDADSRPPRESLAHFRQTASAQPGVDVFHQSSRFELRRARGHWGLRALADAGALRANRFVLAYELPRLLNRVSPNRLRAALGSGSYAHVTGHGLCVRLSLLIEIPLPAQTPVEDMYYSFILGSRRVAMMPIRCLDHSEVPDTVAEQVRQASRWFAGPARFWQYLRDPATRRGPVAYLMALSALAITLEWLSCAIVPMLLLILLAIAGLVTRLLIVAFVLCYAVQLVVAEATLASPSPLPRRLGRLMAYPLSSTLFGVGGIVGVAALLLGGGLGKTERTH